MSGTGNKSGQGERTVGRLERRSSDSRWAELLDSTGWTRSPTARPPSRGEPPVAAPEPAPPFAPPPAVETLPASPEPAPEDEAPPLSPAPTPSEPTPKAGEASAQTLTEPQASRLAPLLAEAEAAAPEPLSPPAGNETGLPASNAGLFDDWAKIEGAGWGGSASRAARPQHPLPLPVAQPAPSRVDQRSAGLRDATGASEAKLQTLRREIADLEARRDQLTGDLTSAGEKLAGERAELAKLTDELVAAQTGLAAAVLERAALDEAIEARGAELADRQARVAEVENQLANLAAEATEAGERLIRDRQTQEALASERASLVAALESLAGDHDRRHSDLAALERESREVQDRLAEVRTDLQASQEALAQTAESLAAAGREQAKSAATREELAESLGVLRDEHASIREAVALSPTALDGLEAERRRLSDEIAAATERGSELAAEARDILHRRDLAAEETAGLTRQSEALRAEIVQAREECTRAVQDLQERRQEFQTVYNRDKRLLNKIQREIAAAKRELEQVKSQKCDPPAKT